MINFLFEKNKYLFIAVFGIITTYTCFGQTDLSYYLPEDVSLKSEVPTPGEVLGFEVGEWHVSHDQLVYYFYELAKSSSRVSVERFGRTHENRPLINVIITSEKNHENLEEIRNNHLKLSDPHKSENLDLSAMPLVVRLGYSIHGNEASGGNASLLVGYYLAAAQDPAIQSLLDNTVILIDPCLNPDGFQRFSTWVNEHRSKNLVADANNRENNEPWPGGRTNHYWFDLNRDWLLVRHPESVGRVDLFHKWKPNIQTDHHEMGSHATFFFQPGVESRTHPLIPASNTELTAKIAEYHAASLDKNKRLYYDGETFDDFYFGKGSSYPDIHGAIGILFEQASPRGHLRQTRNGLLSFPFAIKNQVTTSLSTLKAGIDMRVDLLEHQKTFFRDALNEGEKDPDKCYIFGTNDDPHRAQMLADLLRQHQINLLRPDRDIVVEGTAFKAANSFMIPLDQPQYRLVKALFEKRTTFMDSVFYDVSTWSMDLSFNLDFKELKRSEAGGIPWEGAHSYSGGCDGESAYAYAISWKQDMAPALLYQLLDKNIRVRVATDNFEDHNGNKYQRGTLVIPLGIQEITPREIQDLLDRYGKKYGVQVLRISSGSSKSGIDLGSNRMSPLEKPRFLMLVGNGVSSYEAGEAWHLMDNTLDMHVSLVTIERLARINLNAYTTIIMPNGNYGKISTTGKNKITEWLKEGGSIIAWKGGLEWLKQAELLNVNTTRFKADSTKKFNYVEAPHYRGAQNVSGAILAANLDTTHPIAYGYSSNLLPIFKNDELILHAETHHTIHPVAYTQNPLLSGYLPKKMAPLLAGTPAVSISSLGSGKIIAFTDNLMFRGIWYGTHRLFINSLFFSKTIDIR